MARDQAVWEKVEALPWDAEVGQGFVLWCRHRDLVGPAMVAAPPELAKVQRRYRDRG